MPLNAKTVIAKSEELPSLSKTALKLIKMLDDSEVARLTVADTLSLDEVLAASVFKYANSAAVGARVKFTNMIAVIDYIGLANVKNLVVLVAAKQVIKDDRLWLRSVFISNACKKIAMLVNESREFLDLSFLLALFHNLGSLVFRIYYRDDFQQSSSITDFQKRLIKEQDLFGINHLELAATILERWKFTAELIDLVKSQHEIKTKHNTLVEIARRLYEIQEVNQGNIDTVLDESQLKQKMQKYGLDTVNFTEDFVNELFDEAEASVSAW